VSPADRARDEEMPVPDIREFVRTRWPWTGSGHGPLPALLVVLTIVTGLVDAVSYLALGHVFVANMTGNVVFLGFAMAGAPGLSATASLAALGGFLVGGVVGGRIGARLAAHRGRNLRAAAATSVALVSVAVVVAAVAGQPVSHSARWGLIVALAAAMGVQNAAARRLAVPDLTTTVLTQTLTGLAADSRLGGGTGGHPARRLIAILAMLTGALGGALLVLHASLVFPLAIAALLMATTGAAAHRLSAAREAPTWTEGPESR
jgi:uncharacterized membrane protein YoaK (UPF0700 family)